METNTTTEPVSPNFVDPDARLVWEMSYLLLEAGLEQMSFQLYSAVCHCPTVRP